MIHLIPAKHIPSDSDLLVKYLCVGEEKYLFDGQEMVEVEALKFVYSKTEIDKLLSDQVSYLVDRSAVKPFIPTRVNTKTDGEDVSTSLMLAELDMRAYALGIEIFERNGLVYDSKHLDIISLPYEYDGVYLKIDYTDAKNNYSGGYKKIYKAAYHNVTVRVPELLTLYPVCSIKK